MSHFPLSWQRGLAGGLLIRSCMALLFVSIGLVGGMGSVFSLRAKP